MSQIRAVSNEKQAVGRRIKSSKYKFSWKFFMDNEEHTLEFYSSKVSKKREIIFDGQKIPVQNSKQPSHYFEFSSHSFVIQENKIGPELLIDTIPFGSLASFEPDIRDRSESAPQILGGNFNQWERYARPYKITRRLNLEKAEIQHPPLEPHQPRVSRFFSQKQPSENPRTMSLQQNFMNLNKSDSLAKSIFDDQFSN